MTRGRAFQQEWDVLVAGGGPAGCAAAVAAAREGARTMLLESSTSLGGMGTGGLNTMWAPYSDGKRVVYGGLAEKMMTACKKAMKHVPADRVDWVPIDAELVKRLYDNLVTEAGVKVVFQAFVCQAKSAKNNLTSVTVASKRGLDEVRAKTYIDCTGDADLAAWAGAEYQQGDGQGEIQPATLCFILSNVDDFALTHGPSLKAGPLSAIHKSGRYPEIKDNHLCYKLVGPGTVSFNAGHIWDCDNTDPESVSAALIEGRKIALAFRNALAEFHPAAFGHAFLACTAPLMGVRETRRILGDYVLTVHDYRLRRSFPDEIARSSYVIDIHTSKAERELGKRGEYAEIERRLVARFEPYGPGESHGIPYRCLTPKGIGNLLVAGRCVSCDREVQGAIRTMPACLCMGESAGIAAAQAVQAGNCDIHRVDVAKLRERLRQCGAYLPETTAVKEALC